MHFDGDVQIRPIFLGAENIDAIPASLHRIVKDANKNISDNNYFSEFPCCGFNFSLSAELVAVLVSSKVKDNKIDQKVLVDLASVIKTKDHVEHARALREKAETENVRRQIEEKRDQSAQNTTAQASAHATSDVLRKTKDAMLKTAERRAAIAKQQFLLRQPPPLPSKPVIPGNSTAADANKQTEKDAFPDLSRSMWPHPHEEVQFHVSRGDYSQMAAFVKSPYRRSVMTGGTGSGKSTAALLPLFQATHHRVILVEPTAANVANIIYEFANVLPNLVKRGNLEGKVPSCVVWEKGPFPSQGQLIVTTCSVMVDLILRSGSMPRCEYLAIDEFHLPFSSMVNLVYMVRNVNFGSRYILISATAPGRQVVGSYPKDVRVRYSKNISSQTFPTSVRSGELNPRFWRDITTGSMAVVTASSGDAVRLSSMYDDAQIPNYLITEHTTLEQFVRARADDRRVVYVLSNRVEAGITLRIGALVSLGTTEEVRYDGKTVYKARFPLGPAATIQRGSRGGRVIPTVFVSPSDISHVDKEADTDYLQANAVIYALALGVSVQRLYKTSAATRFPRLLSVPRSLAVAAVQSSPTDPLLSVYRHNDEGQVYVECGGKGRGFSRLAAKDLILYHWPKGFFVAPVADFSRDDTSPAAFVQREYQLKATQAMFAETRKKLTAEQLSLETLVDTVVMSLDRYMPDLVASLAKVMSLSKPSYYTMNFSDAESSRYPTIADFLGGSKADKDIVRLLDHVTTSTMSKMEADFKPPRVDETNGQLSVRMTNSLTLHACGKTVHIAFPSSYNTASNTIDVNRVSREITDAMMDILSVELLQRYCPEKCVDLTEYVYSISKDHSWFAANVANSL